MVWPLIAMVALSAASASSSSAAAKGNAKSQRAIARGNKQASELIRNANNKYTAAAGNLNRQRQIIRNQFQLQNQSDALDDLNINFDRAMAASQEGGLDAQIASAEQAGALRAQQAFLGGGGSTTQALSMTNALREARVENMRDIQLSQVTQDHTAQVQDAMAGMFLGIEGLDMVDDMNMAETIEQYVAKPNMSAFVINFATDVVNAVDKSGGLSFKSSTKAAQPGSSGTVNPNTGSGFAGH